MAESVGNTIPAPGFNGDLDFTVNLELLYSTEGVHQRGVTLKSGQGVLPLGTALKKDASTNYYVQATTANTTVGILRQTTDTDTDSNASAWQANILQGGWLKFDLVSSANAFDVSAIAGAKVDAVRGYFRF